MRHAECAEKQPVAEGTECKREINTGRTEPGEIDHVHHTKDEMRCHAREWLVHGGWLITLWHNRCPVPYIL